jgi:hypothetical protein
MAAGFNPKIVTNGLVFHLDGANIKSYRKTGTSCNDISGQGYTATLVNDITYENSNLGVFFINNLSEETYISTNFDLALGDFTVSVWFRRVGSLNILNSERIVDKNLAQGFWLGRSGTNSNLWGGGVRESTSPFGRYITLNSGDWHYLVSRRSGTTHTIFGDGITNTATGTVSNTAISTAFMRLGADQRDTSIFNGNIAMVSVYNRALSDSEILQNFNATRGRFKI